MAGMIELVNYTIKRYLYARNGIYYYVDIYDSGASMEAWLTREEYGVSNAMFESPKHYDGKTLTEEYFLQTVLANLPDYCDSYEEEYTEEE